jgi:hypothetical protein
MLAVAAGLSLLARPSSARLETQYVTLSDLKQQGKTWTAQSDVLELISPQVAVSRGVIRAQDARQYRAVLVNQNPQRRSISINLNARITLLTFPSFAPKTATLKNLFDLLETNPALPSEFEVINLFAITSQGGQVVSITQSNVRAPTGVYEQALLLTKKTSFVPFKPVVDFVNVYTTESQMRRDGQTMQDNPSGLYISNNNPALRSIAFAREGRIQLLRSAAEYLEVTPQQLEAGLNGQDFGWRFDWSTYFEARISDLTGEMFHLRQGYLP